MSELYRESNAEEPALTQEQEEQYEQWMKDHPEVVRAPEDLRESGPEVAELEELLISFESEHSLEELLTITELIPQEASQSTLRESAKASLIPIVEKLNVLKEETNISSEAYLELKEKYKRLSQAVGIIHGTSVDHTR